MEYLHPISYAGVVLSGILLVGVIVVALSLNDAIDESIVYGLGDENNVDTSLLTAKWVYAGVGGVILLLLAWFTHSIIMKHYYRYKTGYDLPQQKVVECT